MVDMTERQVESGTRTAATNRWRRVAWILILIVDVGFVAWGAMVAWSPVHVLGPGGKAILPAGYEGFSGGSWSHLVAASAPTAGYMVVLYRTYGFYNVAFGLVASAIAITAFRRSETWAWWALLAGNTITLVSAITYDRTVHAIGPFEVSEYLGLALVWAALAATAPFVGRGAIR
jgi:hypothetical protein